MASIIGINYKKSELIVPPTKVNLTHEGFLSKDPKRQVSFITLEGENRLREDSVKGYCHERFNADFVITCLDSSDISLGSQIKLGTSIIEITELGKECHEACPAITSKGSCTVNDVIFFGKIVKEGLAKLNDKIKYL